MSYIALYRKWRPLIFEDVVEQSVVVQTLKNSVTSDRIGHAYLFCGSRGTGKTSIAKIFSRAINCLDLQNGDPCNVCKICKGILTGSNMDVIEIDAASNNGVDNIREIRDEVLYTPSESRFKVYIIDEVHMLSTGAFNALLKTLEEPPSHVIFILATTEAHKLPATILSRCQRYDFRRISVEAIAKRLNKIAENSGFSLSSQSADIIARLSEGGLRDAISILDQCFSSGKTIIEAKDVIATVGISDFDFIKKFADSIISNNTVSIFDLIEELINSGRDTRYFISQLILFFRDLMVISHTLDANSLSFPVSEDKDKLLSIAKSIEQRKIIAIIKELSILENNIKWSKSPRILIEITLIKICDGKFLDTFDEINSRLDKLETNQQNSTVSYNIGPKISNYSNTEITKSTTEKKTPPKPTFSEENNNKRPVTFWNEIIEELKSMGRMTIYTNIMDSIAYFSGDNMIIVMPSNAFNKETLAKSENIEVLSTLLSKKMNKEIRVKITDQSFVDLKMNEDLSIVKARDIAKKANIPLNIIDE